MKILVTGANGFIGSNLVKKLTKFGHNVTGISLNNNTINNTIIHGINICDKNRLHNFFQNKNYDVFIHLAAQIPIDLNGKEAVEAYKSNIKSTQNILNEFKYNKAKILIFASSASVYGINNIKKEINEKSPVNPSNLYALSKLNCEKLCQQYINYHKKIIIIFRISAPYGPGQNPITVIPKFINQAINSENLTVFGKGKRSQDFVFIDDLSEAFILSLKQKESNIFNIGSNESISTIKLAKLVIKSIPNTESKILYTHKDLEEKYYLKLDTSKAQKILGFKPKTFIKEGIQKSIDYWLQIKKC